MTPHYCEAGCGREARDGEICTRCLEERRGGNATAKKKSTGAMAAIEGRDIIIRLEIRNIPIAVEGGCSLGSIEPPFRVTNPKAFAKDLVNILNAEDEQGTTRIHRMFDEAFGDAVNNGADGWEEAPDDAR